MVGRVVRQGGVGSAPRHGRPSYPPIGPQGATGLWWLGRHNGNRLYEIIDALVDSEAGIRELRVPGRIGVRTDGLKTGHGEKAMTGVRRVWAWMASPAGINVSSVENSGLTENLGMSRRLCETA